MSVMQIEHLSFTYPGSFDPVFEDVSLRFDTRWKLGLIGRNGRGKTTLLRLLLGQYACGGAVHTSVPCDYFPYPVHDPDQPTGTVLQSVCPEAQEWALLRELSLLEVDEDAFWRPFSTLSGGEQTKALLAALFLREGRFPLIDEPTNHLDAHARAVLSGYLRRKRGFLLVSHDRHFLDGCVDHIVSLNRADIGVQAGNFSSWWQNYERQQAFEATQDARLQKEIAGLQKAARRTAGWSDRTEAAKYGGGPVDRGFIGHKSAKMMQRAKSIAARQERAIAQKSSLLHNRERAERLKLSPLCYHADRLASFSQAAAVYDGHPAGAPVSFEVHRGDRIALDGRNGCGKTSLLRLLTGAPIDHCGTVTVASGLVISYVPQDTAHLRGSLPDFIAAHGLDETLFKSILRKMDFARAQFEKDMAAYSAGQKKKVLLAKSLCERAHLYVWDEPLNYIDVFSRMQIEQLLAEFAPTMVFVEHDRAFRDAVATKIIGL